MSLLQLELTKAEKRNRVIWTMLALGSYLPVPVISLVLCIISCFRMHLLEALIFGLIFAISIIPSWTIWHCVYKKHGTRLLTFLIFSGWFLCMVYAVGATIYPSLHATYVETLAQTPPWTFLISIPLSLCWLLMGLQLRNTNKKLYLKKHVTEEYVSALEQMKSSPSLEDLEAQFGALVRQWPKLEGYSSKAYKIKKSNSY